MTDKTTADFETTSAHQDHLTWTQDLLRWECEHISALGSLHAIIVHLEDHAAEIRRHTVAIARHDGTGGKESLAVHDDEARAHDRLGKRHDSIILSIAKLRALVIDPA